MPRFISLSSAMRPNVAIHVEGCRCVVSRRVAQIRSKPFEAADLNAARKLVQQDVPEGVAVTIAPCTKGAR